MRQENWFHDKNSKIFHKWLTNHNVIEKIIRWIIYAYKICQNAKGKSNTLTQPTHEKLFTIRQRTIKQTKAMAIGVIRKLSGI